MRCTRIRTCAWFFLLARLSSGLGDRGRYAIEESKMQKRTIDGIPGLFVFNDYFTALQCDTLTQKTLDLHLRLEEAATLQSPKMATIPQPEFVRSEQHNLQTEEYYARVELPRAASSGTLRCEYFPRYGEEGHSLGYIRGNSNIPDFIAGDVLTSVRNTIDDLGLADSEQKLTWKLTLNFYKNIGGTIAGFPFHVDIPANGIVTMILNVQREALFQIAKREVSEDIVLPVGALLILSGESRYEWKHRVLPTEGVKPLSPNIVDRVSLVLGFQ